MAEGVRRITRSKTGSLPGAKRKRTNSVEKRVDSIVNLTTEQVTGKRLKENLPSDSVPEEPVSKRKGKQLKLKPSSPKATNPRTQTKRIQKNSDKSADPKQSKKVSSSKAMKKEDVESLLNSLQQIDDRLIQCEVSNKLKRVFEDAVLIKQFANSLSETEQPLKSLVHHHHQCFCALYKSSKKQQDSFLHFQLSWHKHCSAFLLSEEYSLADITFQELSDLPVSDLRKQWLDYSKMNGVPVPHCNPVMIEISSTIYSFLLEHVANFQHCLIESRNATTNGSDDDDVYYRFGGATLCSMLHRLYSEIKGCSSDLRDSLSQKIAVLQAINTKDKSSIPGYLKYRDRGFMYFPDPSFISFIREIDTVLKQVINAKGLNEHGDELVKVAHSLLASQEHLEQLFRSTLSQRMPNMDSINDEILKSVYEEFTRKICNTRIQEFVSSTKQQLATKKGAASTVEVNLRNTLLVHHTKLESKLAKN